MAPTQLDAVTDDEVITWWGLVIEGYAATQDKLMGAIAKGWDLSPACFDIVIRLLRSDGHRMAMTRLAREAALSSGGFTKVADRLVKAGLVRREPSDTDRRVIYATLTEHGVEVANHARTTCAAVLREIVLDPLGAQRAATMAETMRTLRAVNHDHPPEDDK